MSDSKIYQNNCEIEKFNGIKKFPSQKIDKIGNYYFLKFNAMNAKILTLPNCFSRIFG